MHSPVSLAEACRRAIDQIQISYDRLLATREAGGHFATVTTRDDGDIEVVIPFTGGDRPYEAVCPCGDDGAELVYLDGAPHRALCSRCTAADRHKDADGNYLATALGTLLMDITPHPAPSYYEPAPPEIQPEYSPNTSPPAQESIFATSDDEAYCRMHPERED